jgi:predicted transcriptional regulator
LRDFQGIIAGILRCVQEGQGVTKTRIVNKAQLSSSQLKEYIYYLRQQELVNYDEEKRIFRITRKGKRFLKLYDEMSELAPRRK